MNESNELYNVREHLNKQVSGKINSEINSYIKKYRRDIRYFLQYPLIEIELGIHKHPAENRKNELLRDTFGFLIEKTFCEWTKLDIKKKVSRKGFEIYKNKCSHVLQTMWRDNYTLIVDIKDGSSYAKNRIEKIDNNKYKLTTSFVYNKYKEENFYFYDIDEDRPKFNNETFMKQFAPKYIFSVNNIDNLCEHIDYELLSNYYLIVKNKL